MVPFPKNEEYIGDSKIRSFVEKKWKDWGGSTGYVSVSLYGLGGAG
jgi:hypothetical protein